MFPVHGQDSGTTSRLSADLAGRSFENGTLRRHSVRRHFLLVIVAACGILSNSAQTSDYGSVADAADRPRHC